jgi:hypothetical protein
MQLFYVLYLSTVNIFCLESGSGTRSGSETLISSDWTRWWFITVICRQLLRDGCYAVPVLLVSNNVSVNVELSLCMYFSDLSVHSWQACSSSCFFLFSFAIVGVSQSMLSLYTGLGLYAVSTAFVVPCLTTLVSQVCDPDPDFVGWLRIRTCLPGTGNIPNVFAMNRCNKYWWNEAVSCVNKFWRKKFSCSKLFTVNLDPEGS